MKLAFAVANLGIFCGYLFIATMIVPSIEVRKWYTKVGGFFFFVTCGLTHLEQAVHVYDSVSRAESILSSWHMVIIHSVQVVAVWMFIYGLYVEFVQPELRPRK